MTAEAQQKYVKTYIFLHIGFYQISRYLFILGHMLLYKLSINVAIANTLTIRFTLEDLPESKYKILKSGFEENRFLANISLCAHLRSYVAS